MILTGPEIRRLAEGGIGPNGERITIRPFDPARIGPETWRRVVGYEGTYEVSNHGRVRSVDRVSSRRNSRDRFYRGQLIATAKHSTGYRSVSLKISGDRKTFLVHDLVLTAFVGQRPTGAVCRHLDGDKANNVLGNLAWGTYSENCDDSYHHGTFAVGERHHACKLSDAAVQSIREKYAGGGVTQKSLAAEYGVWQATISAIVLKIRRRRPTNPTQCEVPKS